jgi:integrase
MASIVNDPNGRKRIQVQRPDGRRGTIRLGQMSTRDAEKILTHVRALESAALSNTSLDASVIAWLRGISPRLHKRIAANKLCDPRGKATPNTLQAVIDAFVARRSDVKPQTKLVWQQAKNHLTRIVGAGRDIAEITPADADDFRRTMRAEYSEAFTAKMVMVSKAIFRDAVRRRLIAESPFATVRNGSQRNPDRQFYVDRATVEKIIAKATDPEWKAMIALARYAGVRVPSEPMALKWGDIDFEQGRLTIHAAKTAHHEGKGVRVIPLFPEVEKHLLTLLEQAEEGATHVFTRLRRPNANLRTTFTKLVTRAGFTPWPRLFNALRASCATDLAAKHPAHVAAAWMGHSESIARGHYLKVTDADFANALESEGAPKCAPGHNGNKRDERQPVHIAGGFPPEKAVSPEKAVLCETGQVGDEGFEPPTLSV